MGTKRSFWTYLGYNTVILDCFWVQNYPSELLFDTKRYYWTAFAYKTFLLGRLWVQNGPSGPLLGKHGHSGPFWVQHGPFGPLFGTKSTSWQLTYSVTLTNASGKADLG